MTARCSYASFNNLVITVVLSYCISAPNVCGYKYLFQGYTGEGSHFLTSAYLAETLVKRGHEVSYVISSASSYRLSDSRWGTLFDYIIYQNPHPDNAFRRKTDDFVKASFRDGITRAMLKSSEMVFNTMIPDCETLLSNQTIINELKAKQYDILVFDGGWLCSPLLAEMLNIRKIMVNPSGYNPGVAGLAGSPTNLAFIPTQLEPQSTLPLSFTERLQNLLYFWYSQITLGSALVPPYYELQEKFNISKNKPFAEILTDKLELVLINMDAEIELTVPLTPNVIPVGGLTAEPAKQLPEDLEDFVNRAGKDGVIVFSLGSYVSQLPHWLTDEIIKGFASVPYKILWKFDNQDGREMPLNVMTRKWLPLNDLLGHNQTRAFIFHGGNNGFYEALYHGVPMVVLPVMGDQAQVAKRATSRGICLELDIRTLTADELRDAIMEIMTNERIKSNMRHFRDVYHHKPMNATARAAYWIEHVTRYGGSIYKPQTDHLSILQYTLLDVAAVVLLAAIIFIFISFKMFFKFCRLLQGWISRR